MKMFTLAWLLAALGVGIALPQIEITMPTEIGNMTLLKDSLSTDGHGFLTVEGSVRNETPFRVRYLKFELVYYNASNVDIKACGPTIGCEVTVFDPIDSHSSVRLKRPGNHIYPSSTLNAD